MIRERVNSARDAEPDLFSFVIETKDPETGNVFKLNDLWAESRFFLIAGRDLSDVLSKQVANLDRLRYLCYCAFECILLPLPLSDGPQKAGRRARKGVYLQ